jgi:hypothetical protein
VSDERVKRIGANEAVFRAANNQVEELNQAFSTLTGSIVIVCECGDGDCFEQIELPLEAYREVRSEPTLFIVKPGHVADEVEYVVSESGDYVVLRKRPGEPQRLAEELETPADR